MYVLILSVRTEDCFSMTSYYDGNCAISNGAIVCWGSNGRGEVSNAPTDTDFVSVSSLGQHICGLHSNGAITCWGSNSLGQVSNTPTDTDFVYISNGWHFTCGLRSSTGGAITCWGDNRFGQATPPTHTDFIAVYGMGFHACGLRSSGAILCWGRDDVGQVSNAPTDTDFVALSGSATHSCGLRASGAITCWGADEFGKIRDVPTDTDFVAISSGSNHICGLHSSGAMTCWGRSNYYQVRDHPTYTGFVAISSGNEHSCGLHASGAITCWGKDHSGQVSNTPTQNDFVFPCGGTEPTNFPSRIPTAFPTTEPTRIPTFNPTLDPTRLGYVDDSTCEWHELNKKNKFINSEQFFGFECPPNQIIADLRLQGNEGSVLNNNPTAISCCKLGGHSVVTDTCIDSFSNAAGELDEAICTGNSAMVALYDLSDPTLDQSLWEYQGTKGITCCDIEYDTAHGKQHDFGIDRSNCQVISHSSPVGNFEVACPADMVLVEIRDNDPANGVQEVHEISCCPLHDMAAPTQAPTFTAPTLAPTSSEPSTAPTTSCHDCLISVRGQQGSDQEFVSKVETCLSLCCA